MHELRQQKEGKHQEGFDGKGGVEVGISGEPLQTNTEEPVEGTISSQSSLYGP